MAIPWPPPLAFPDAATVTPAMRFTFFSTDPQVEHTRGLVVATSQLPAEPDPTVHYLHVSDAQWAAMQEGA